MLLRERVALGIDATVVHLAEESEYISVLSSVLKSPPPKNSPPATKKIYNKIAHE